MRIDKPKILKPTADRDGYLSVNLYDNNGKCKTTKIHRIVATAFIINQDGKRCVCHKDNNPSNNNVSNLYWGTDKENQDQAWRDGLHKNIMPVKQLSMDGKCVNVFASQNEAARKTKVFQQNIAKCVAGTRKSAGGYLWQRLD